jgi:predicted kinase
MKELFLLRGLPGSGKSTLAKSLGGKHLEADMYFMEDGEYKFDATKLRKAHEWCQNETYLSMATNWERIVVSNTFTQEWEMKSYYDLAERYGYRVYSLVVENRHGGVNQHGVPEEKIKEMAQRFNVKIL